MIDAFSAYLTTSGILPEGSKTIVACSGGADSMVLADMLHRLDYPLVLAHVNYGLRGADSDADEDLVRRYAADHGLEVVVEHVNTAAFIEGQKDGLQALARRLRYDFFSRLQADVGASHIATAHHREDLIETYLMHVLRGSHWRGFRSIPRVNGSVVRPLLHVAREDMLAYAQEHGVPWRHDASNDAPDYMRNRVRHELIPLMQELRPGFDRNILRQIELFIEISDIMDGFLGKLATDVILLRPEGLYISITGMDELPFMRLLLLQVIGDYGFDAHRVDEAVSLVYAEPGKAIYSSSHRIVREREHLVISPKPEQQPDPGLIELDTEELLSPEHLIIDLLTGDDVYRYTDDENEAVMDVAALTFPLEVRRWQAGDRIRPIGLKGSVKVSDLVTSAKLSRIEREQLCVVCSGEELVWVIGLRLADSVKITSSTKSALRVSKVTD